MGTVVFKGIRIDDAEDETTWLDFGSGKGATPTQETDFVYQGSFSVSEKTGTSEDGVGWDGESETPAETYDLSTATGNQQVLILKHIATTSGILNNKGSTGGNVQVGSGGRKTNFKDFYVVGGDTYPIKGGFLITPIDPNADASSTSATAPTLSAINWIAWSCTFSGTSKVENVAMDAIDAIGYRQGLTVTGSNSSVDDFISFDEGTQNNRYGIISTFEGINYVTGTLTVGDSSGTTSTQFTDTNDVYVFPSAEFLAQDGFFGFDFFLHNASDAITLTNCTYKSLGDSAGSSAGGSPVDTRPTHEMFGTAGTLTANGLVFDGFNKIILEAAASLTNTSFINGSTVFANGATLTTATFNDMTDSSSLVTSVTNLGSKESGLTFTKTAGTAGHAINLGSVAQLGDSSVDLNTITFNGYGTGTTGTFAGAITRDSAAISCNVGTGNTLTINVLGTSTIPTVENLGSGTIVVDQSVLTTISGVLGNSEIKVLPTAGSPYSGNTLSDTLNISTETVSADTIVGDGTNSVTYSNNGGFVQINAAGTSTFSGVLTDGDGTTALAAGDTVRVTVRDDTDNPSLQLFDEFEVDGTPSASAILTTTSFSTFTSSFGTTLNSANSKTVTVEKVDAKFTFSVSGGTVIDFLVYRTGSDPILSLNNTILSGAASFPISQVQDRNYRDPA